MLKPLACRPRATRASTTPYGSSTSRVRACTTAAWVVLALGLTVDDGDVAAQPSEPDGHGESCGPGPDDQDVGGGRKHDDLRGQRLLVNNCWHQLCADRLSKSTRVGLHLLA